MKAQVSVEYLLLIGFAMAVLVPGVFFMYSYTQSNSGEFSSTQYTLLGEQMLSTANKAKAQGTGTWLITTAQLPQSIVDIEIAGSGREIVITYQTGMGESKVVFFTDTVNLKNQGGGDGSIFQSGAHGGTTKFRFAVDNSGVITVTEDI
jgi:hypothetical protein